MSFTIRITGNETDSVVLLTDTNNQTTVEIFTFGALLNAYTVVCDGQPLNVVDGFGSVDKAKQKISPMFNGAKLSPFVCRLKNRKYKFADNTYLLNKFNLGDHAIHGLLFDAAFSVIESSSSDKEACVKLQYVYDNDVDGYPFCYRCEVEYLFTENNSLTVTTTITNIDEQLIPIADGWHPYFTLGGSVNDYQLKFQSKEMLEFDEGLIPTGKLKPYQEFGSLKTLGSNNFDNCFTLNFAECQPMCVLRNPDKKIQLEIYPTSSYPYLQIFTPDHRKSIAIENLSAPPDAFNNGIGLKILEPRETASFTTKFVLHHL
ncbi:MAG: aldose 1-epimerase [Segetibacter sp.]|nr:aldose 1-epimerase [Segetibacter sp.]